MPKRVNLEELRESRDTWAPVVTDGMSPECVQKYLTRKKAVDLYIDGVSPKIVSQQTKLGNSYICYLINRCTTMDQNTGEVPGYSSLVPRKILNHEHTKIVAEICK